MASLNLNKQLKEQWAHSLSHKKFSNSFSISSKSYFYSSILFRFVSNLTGSSFTKIFVLLAIVPVSFCHICFSELTHCLIPWVIYILFWFQTSTLLRQAFNSYRSIGNLNFNLCLININELLIFFFLVQTRRHRRRRRMMS